MKKCFLLVAIFAGVVALVGYSFKDDLEPAVQGSSQANSTVNDTTSATTQVDFTACGHPVLNPSQIIATAKEGGSGKRKVKVNLLNAGPSTLAIESISTSCSCTIAEPVPKRSLAAGESIDLVVGIQVPETGESQQSVRIEFSGTDVREVSIPIHMIGAPLQPPYIRFRPQAYLTLTRKAGEDHYEGFLEFSCIEKPKTPPWAKSVVVGDMRFNAIIESVDTGEVFAEAIQRNYIVKVTTELEALSNEANVVQTRCDISALNGDVICASTIGCDLSPPVRMIPSLVRLNSTVESKSIERDIILCSSDGQSMGQVKLVAPIEGIELIDSGNDTETTRRIKLRFRHQDVVGEKTVALALNHPVVKEVSFRVVVGK